MSWEIITASVIASVIAAAAIGFGGWMVRKMTDLAGLPAELKALSDRFAKEFGGNSNGLRQTVDGLTTRVDSIQKDVREVRARLDFHIDHRSEQ